MLLPCAATMVDTMLCGVTLLICTYAPCVSYRILPGVHHTLAVFLKPSTLFQGEHCIAGLDARLLVVSMSLSFGIIPISLVLAFTAIDQSTMPQLELSSLTNLPFLYASESICLDGVQNTYWMLICHGSCIVEVQAMSSLRRDIPTGRIARSRVKQVLDCGSFVVWQQTGAETVRYVILAIHHIHRPSEVCRGHESSVGQELAQCHGLLGRFSNIEHC